MVFSAVISPLVGFFTESVQSRSTSSSRLTPFFMIQSLPGINRQPEGPLNVFWPSLHTPAGTLRASVGKHDLRSSLRSKLKSHSKSSAVHLQGSKVGCGGMNSSKKQSASALRLMKDC